MKAPLDSPDEGRHRRALAQAINTNDDGKSGTVTLEANAASTTIIDARIASTSPVLLIPVTANAAAEQAAGTLYYLNANRVHQSLDLVHANNAQTDRTFYYVILGN
jgi:hypothetical protein